jgi:hypothetical protein
MINEIIAKDPFGKMIHLSPGMILAGNDPDEIYDDAATVIKKPAIIIEVKEDNETQLYYFRSIGWNSTLLIAAKLNNGRWEAYECLKNPSSEILSAVLKKGNQLL